MSDKPRSKLSKIAAANAAQERRASIKQQMGSFMAKNHTSQATDTDSKGTHKTSCNDSEQELGSPLYTFDDASPKPRSLIQSQSKEEKILDAQSYFLVEPSYLNKLRHYCSSDNNPN